ncbi:MAG: hypothetical protein AVDCRST_MAG25-55, partial [uncultured Rubrobacteraceae bacterium]
VARAEHHRLDVRGYRTSGHAGARGLRLLARRGGRPARTHARRLRPRGAVDQRALSRALRAVHGRGVSRVRPRQPGARLRPVPLDGWGHARAAAARCLRPAVEHAGLSEDRAGWDRRGTARGRRDGFLSAHRRRDAPVRGRVSEGRALAGVRAPDRRLDDRRGRGAVRDPGPGRGVVRGLGAPLRRGLCFLDGGHGRAPALREL